MYAPVYHRSRRDIGFKIKILDALSVVNVRRVRLPPSSLPKIIILKPIVFKISGNTICCRSFVLDIIIFFSYDWFIRNRFSVKGVCFP